MMAIVERFIDIDAGHRVARHESKCSNLHGHRYRVTVQVSGVIKDDDSPEHGMVIDFSRIKDALTVIHDQWDHKFLVGDDDPLATDLRALPGTVVLPFQPTAENLATDAARQLTDLLAPLRIVSVSIQETTACTAKVTW